MVKAVKDGYSVVVSDDAFHLVRKSNADILPLYIHGTNDVMPDESSVLARGQVDVAIGKRIPATELQKEGEVTLNDCYQKHYEEWSRSIENTHYFHHYIIYKYIYKGIGLEKETRRLLKRYDDFSKWIDISDAPTEVNVIDSPVTASSLCSMRLCTLRRKSIPLPTTKTTWPWPRVVILCPGTCMYIIAKTMRRLSKKSAVAMSSAFPRF